MSSQRTQCLQLNDKGVVQKLQLLEFETIYNYWANQMEHKGQTFPVIITQHLRKENLIDSQTWWWQYYGLLSGTLCNSYKQNLCKVNKKKIPKGESRGKSW